MLSLQAEYQQLSEEAQLRLQSFYRRFCQGENGRRYGLGHLVYAAHASFPLVLSPRLANLIWLNFKNYYFVNSNDAAQSQQVAVADFLLSPLCRKMGHQRYDVYPEIRSFLLFLLQDGKWFAGYGIKTDGKARVNELAHFLKQFLITQTPDEKYDGVGFRQLNEWAVAAWLDPQLLTRELARSFEQSTANNNEHAQLWLTLQMDKVGMQYGLNVSNAQSNRELSPFYRLYYYGKAREGQLYNKAASDIYQYAGEISEFDASGSSNGEILVKLPLLKSVAERAERKINRVQRVLSLLIGVDRTEHYPDAFVSTYGLTKLRKALSKIGHDDNNMDTSHIVTLRSNDATKKNLLENITSLLSMANPEDTCLIYYAGFSRENLRGNGGIYTYPDHTAKQVDDFISYAELEQVVSSARKQAGLPIIFMLDVNEAFFANVNQATYTTALEKNILVVAVRQTGERHYDRTGEEQVSSFNDALTTVLNRVGSSITYNDLAKYVRFIMQKEYHLQNNEVTLNTPEVRYHRFLSHTPTVPDSAHLLVCNSSTDQWQLLPDDFSVIPFNSVADVYDYVSNQPIRNGAGTVVGDERTNTYQLRIDPDFDLEKEQLYKINLVKPVLYHVVQTGSQPVPDPSSEKSLLDEEFKKLAQHGNALWTVVEDATASMFRELSALFHQNEINYYWTDQISSIHIFRKVRGRFNLSITYLQEKKLHYTGDPDQLIERLKWYLQNYTLLNSQVPFIYKDLDVLINYYWQSASAERFTAPSNDTLSVMAQTMYLEDGGNIRFHPLVVQLTNNESFPLFFAAYFICSNFSIKPIPESNNLLQPGEVREISTDITDLLIEMIEQKTNMQYKVLFNRNPVQLNIKYTS